MPAIKKNIDLGPLTTIKTGGPAAYFIECAGEADILKALQFAHSKNLRIYVLGGGSNSLVSDRGFDGVVIKIANDNLNINEDGRVCAGAGVLWDQLVSEACHQGLSGIEAMSGIPGLVGATPVQNVGAYGQEVSETIESVKAIHRITLSTKIFSAVECDFSYRNSRFKGAEKDQWIITEVIFQLSPKLKPRPKYQELLNALTSDSDWNSEDRLQKILAIRNHVLKIRSSKGMVLNPNDPDTFSLGSFFVNPIVSAAVKDHIFNFAKVKNLSQSPPAHPAGDNMWKLSAAWLIENSGIKKGETRGRAKISSKHVLAITNPNSATTAEILDLADHIQKSVNSEFGVQLEREPVFVE